MAIIRCDNGHYYDNTKFSQCPHCGVLPIIEQEQGQKEAGKPKRFSFFGRQDGYQTAQGAGQSMYGDSDHTVAMSTESQTFAYGDSDHTIAMSGAGGPGRNDDDDRTISIPKPQGSVSRRDDDDDRTISIPKPQGSVSRRDDDDDRTISIPKPVKPVPPRQAVGGGEDRPAETQPRDYVVGWLVCVDGPERGRDYRLYRGFNRLGGSSPMDIIVEKDPGLSASVAAVVVYDDKSNEFLAAQQVGGRALLNGRQIQKAEKLVSGDILEAGESKFQFIPFCCEGRTWEPHE